MGGIKVTKDFKIDSLRASCSCTFLFVASATLNFSIEKVLFLVVACTFSLWLEMFSYVDFTSAFSLSLERASPFSFLQMLSAFTREGFIFHSYECLRPFAR